MKSKVARRTPKRDSYLSLVVAHPLASIKSEAELDAAQRVIARLFAKGTLDDGELMYVDALGDLIAIFEDQNYPFEPASDAGMLRHLLEAKGVTQAELSRGSSISKSSISEVLASKKPFSRQMIRRFAEFFGVDASILSANVGRDLRN